MPLQTDSLATYGVKLLGRQRYLARFDPASQIVNGSSLTQIAFLILFPAEPGNAVSAESLVLRQNEVVRVRILGAQLSLSGGLTTVSLESAGLQIVTSSAQTITTPAIFGAVTALAQGVSFRTDWLELRRTDLDTWSQPPVGAVAGLYTPKLVIAVNKTDAGNVNASVLGAVEVQRFQFDSYDLPDWNPQ